MIEEMAQKEHQDAVRQGQPAAAEKPAGTGLTCHSCQEEANHATLPTTDLQQAQTRNGCVAWTAPLPSGSRVASDLTAHAPSVYARLGIGAPEAPSGALVAVLTSWGRL